MPRILLIDDHAMVREGFRHLLEEADGFEVVAEAGTPSEALAAVRDHAPDLALVDPHFAPALVTRNHAWLAVLVLVAVLGYWSWEWQQSPKGLVSAQAVSDLLSGRESDDSD